MKKLFPLLIENKFQRALVLGTCSYTSADDKGALKWKASIILIKIIGGLSSWLLSASRLTTDELPGSSFEEFNGLGAFVASQDVSQIKWTLFRVGFLGNGPAKPVVASYTGSGKDGMMISRKSIAAWVLNELGESEFIGKTPSLCN